MSKLNLIILFFLLSMSSIFGQEFDLYPPNGLFADDIGQRNSKIDLSKVNGSPYLNEEFSRGTIKTSSKSYPSLLRYNAYTDAIEIKLDANKTTQLLLEEGISAVINNQEYKYLNFKSGNSVKNGYLIQPESIDGKVQLFYRFEKEYIEGEKSNSSYNISSSSRFQEKKEYYILKEGDSFAAPFKNNKKNILNTLSNKRAQVAKFISKNKLKSKNEDDLIKIIKYYNSI